MKNEASYPAVGFRFKVSFTEIFTSHVDSFFMEVGGLGAELEIETLIEAGNLYTHKLPTRVKFNNLVLKRGLPHNGTSQLIKWAEKCIFEMDIKLTKVTVSLLNEKGSPLKNWIFINAYPVKLDYTGLNAKDGQVVIENLELCYQRISKE